MDSLSREILRLIVSQVALSYVYCPDMDQHKKDIGTLRALRLTNTNLSKIASEYLFEDVTLYFTEASHAKMMAIAQHPFYSSCVRSLGIAPQAIFGTYLDGDAFKQRSHLMRGMLTAGGRSMGFFDIPYHHAGYTSLYKQEERLLDKAGDLLKTAFGRFSRLEEVRFTARAPCTVVSIPPTDDAFIRFMWQDRATKNCYDLEHSAMILTAVSHGRSLAVTRFLNSTAFYAIDTMAIDFPEIVFSEQLQRLVMDTKHLNFSIQADHLEGLQQFLIAGKCEKFLGSMKALESLRCSTLKLERCLLSYSSVPYVFGDNTWQHLRRLELIGFHISAKELSEFLSRHRSTLQTLILQHIQLRQGSWFEVFVKLRGTALRVVKAYQLACEELSHRDFSKKVEAVRYDQIPSSDPLDAFLFRGGSWVPDIESNLISKRLEGSP